MASRFGSTGLTAIELLIIISFVAVISVMVSPFFNKSHITQDFDLAIEITESFVTHARATARVYNTDVFMYIGPDNVYGQQAITLIVPGLKKDPSMVEVKEEFFLPAGVRLFSDDGVIHFNPDGEIESPTHNMVLLNTRYDTSREFVIQ
jgi:Tfp pilus assembly protein FimT